MKECQREKDMVKNVRERKNIITIRDKCKIQKEKRKNIRKKTEENKRER